MICPLGAGSASQIVTWSVKTLIFCFQEPETSLIFLLKLIIGPYAEMFIPVLTSPIFEDSFIVFPFLRRSSTNPLTLTFHDYS